ncbi:amidohydrolase [Peristeroidobacter agariperforans]|uniref:amidohydrolase n=1 Tax=Peristeroidobacter agariperforans TaxID=268404 RepID=UPI00101D33B7|nr:amidohydrolase [Peristeroidobacter agariperforans]
MLRKIIDVAVAALLLQSASGVASAAPDAVYFNANVWTGDPQQPKAEAIAIDDGSIVAVGSTAEVRKLADAKTRAIDLQGAFVVPGFIDNHVHFINGGMALAQVDLRDAATRAEFTQRIAQAAAKTPKGQWVKDGNWDHELWGGELPTRDWIDKDTATTPVFISRLDGHMALANSLVLKLAGIDEKTPDPEGGTIVRDRNGRPTGVLKDNAMNLVSKAIPPLSDQELAAGLESAMEHAVARGVTQVHDMGGIEDWRVIELYRRARASDKLRLRIYSFAPLADWQKAAEYKKRNGSGDAWLRWGGLKGFVDGSLGSTTAWFHKPYDDAPNTTGLTMVDPEQLRAAITAANQAGLHVAVHAIGDRANDWLLDAFEKVEQVGPKKDWRFRIEHAQHLTPAAIERFGPLGVVPSMQPAHAIDDGRWAEKRIGAERLKGTYAFRSLIGSGAHLTFGSDWPVAPLDPLTGIYAAVTRRTADGANPNGWLPQQKITVAEALRAYTAENAWAGFQEGKVGVLKQGALADFAVLSKDLFAVPATQIINVKVVRTVVGGREMYLAR